MKKMVGKLQDVVSGGSLTNNTQGGNYNNTGSNINIEAGDNQKNASSLNSPAATLENSQADTKGNQANANSTQSKSDKSPFKSEEDAKKWIDEANKALEDAKVELRFKFHKEVGMFSVAVINQNTDEVIKELPPEDMVKNMIKGKIWMDAFIGTLVDENA
jgi:flagellar protein FlaG